jgi:hypothetical protein
MRLYLVHCGYYDKSVGDGIYELHTNFFVVAENPEEAKAHAKQLAEYKRCKMHVDGLQEIEAVEGYRIKPVEDKKLAGETILRNVKSRGGHTSRSASASA